MAYDPGAEAVGLMSLHAAKGLEFDVVFVAGCEEGILPDGSEDRMSSLDEERRLFYVGMTRARRHLFLTRACRRTRYGKTAETSLSRFVKEIPPGLVTRIKRAYKKRNRHVQLDLFE
jgi:superfamily I DNA/RNA helicase